MAILYSASICLVGVVLVAASQNIGMFIGFRFVTGIGSGLLQVCKDPRLIYCSER